MNDYQITWKEETLIVDYKEVYLNTVYIISIFVIYYWHKDPAVILTDIETEVIKSFPFENLYNYKKEATSLLGYKHTIASIEKMKKWKKDF